MSFHSPHLLWLLVPLVLLFSWELARHTSRAATTFPKIARAWAGAFNVSLGARHTTAENRPRIWLWFGLALCIVALARPQWGMIEEQVFDQSREVLIAVDLSKSMLAQDVKPSRLARSKLLIQSLLDGLKGERVGLVVFAGTAFLQSPLSADYEILREFLPAMGPDYLPEGGTNYRALLETAIQAFGTSTADRYLIILSDGEATGADWKPLVEQLKSKGIRVIGLGVGTAQGSFIPDPAGGLVKDERGAVVLARLNSATLQELAQVTGGAYTDASTWVDLPALLKKTVESGKKGDFSEKNTARKIERFQWFLAPGLLLLLISFWAEFPVRPRERRLPLATGNQPPRIKPDKTTAAASLAAFFAALLFAGWPHQAGAQEPTAKDTFSKALSTTVARLADQSTIDAKDYSELAQATITYGQRLKSAQQHASEKVIGDALQAVDEGEKTDAKAADWPHLRQELQALLKKDEPPPEDKKKNDQDQKKQDQQKQDQQKQDQDKQDQQKNGDPNKDPNKDQQDQQKQQQSEQDKKDQQQKDQQNQQKKNDDAFGDMKDKPEQPKPQPKPQPQQNSGTQKVGGQQDNKSDEQMDPELAMPLQKLEQVRNQDSPAKLQQIMQGQQQQKKPGTPGKDW